MSAVDGSRLLWFAFGNERIVVAKTLVIPMRVAVAAAVVSMVLLAECGSPAQNSEPAAIGGQVPSLTVGSNLVLVPALIKTRSGEPVFSLTADDFMLTDNGAEQRLQLEPDTDAQPLALAVIVQTGGRGAAHLENYRNLDAILDAVIGNVPHRVAVVTFDSTPKLALDFTTDTDAASRRIANLSDGDPGAAILDALSFAINLLRQQPQTYRRAALLLSETIDDGSQIPFEDAVRAIDETNTAVFSFAFSSTKTALTHEASKIPRPGGTPYSREPYAAGGCMSREENADPDSHGKRGVQALDCASDLIPPLRLARMAFISARDGLKRNVPESVAQQTGGEYFSFKDAATLSKHLVTISNDVPNFYVLSFHPQSPTPGFHALDLKLKNRPGFDLKSRNSYWIETARSQ